MRPMLATPGDRVPPGDGWIHEVKWDGIRALVGVGADGVRVRTRTERDISIAFPELADLAGVGGPMLLDGEIVALGSGVPTLAAIADRIHLTSARRARELAAANPATLLVFDLLRHGDDDLISRPLRERRERLLGLGLGDVAWQVPPAYDDGPTLLAAAREQGLEGIVSKRLSSPYRPGIRSRDWLKFPIRQTVSLVVGGFRPERESPSRVGALLVGAPEAGGLRFTGRVGSGVAGRTQRRLEALLRPLVLEDCPFAEPPPRQDAAGATWVRPQVVVEVSYLALTRDGRLRQPAVVAVREDISRDEL